MKIDKYVMAELKSYELSQLQHILETLEQYELYASGLHRISGGYAKAEAYDTDDGEDHEDNIVEVICISLESGEAEVGHTSSSKTFYTLARKFLGDRHLTIKQKLHAIKEI